MKEHEIRRFHSRLAARGMRVPTWAERHGFNAKTVYSALRGRFNGRRGGRIVTRVLDAIAGEIAA